MSTPPPSLPPELNPRGPAPRRGRSGGGASSRAAGVAAVRTRSRGRLWLTAVSGTMAVLVVTFSVVGSGLASYYDSKIQRIDVIDSGGPGHPAGGGSGSGSSVAQNFLLVGSDNRAGLTRAEISALHVGSATAANASGRRSDTMILLHLSAHSDKATLISLPRDSYVTIPAYTDDQGKHHSPSQNKLNAAYALGGARLTVQTIELATGVHIDHYIEIGFAGFVKMVDALGGVNVCSTTPLKDAKSGLDIPAGTTELNGAKALAYVRARYVDPTADLGRMKRQQAFLGSVFRTALSTKVLLNPLKLNAFLSATLSSVTLDTGLTRADLLNLATRTHGLSPSNVVFATVPLGNVNYQPGGGLGSTVLWNHTRAAALFKAINEDLPIGGQTSASAAPTGTPVTVAPAHITVQVQNGGGVAGLGAKATTDLTGLGYISAGPAKNATVTGVTTTQILYDPGYNVSLKTLEAAFPGAVVTAVKGQGKVFQIIVGTSYVAPKPVTVTSAGSSGNNPGGVTTTSAAEKVCKTS
jgi:LCP family protein required for cell wall assembly